MSDDDQRMLQALKRVAVALKQAVDVIFRPNGRAVGRDLVARATERDVDSVFMPVLDATDLLTSKLMALTEHYCDLAGIFPTARALREQIDWPRARRETADSPFAEAFFLLAGRLGLTDDASAAA